MHGSTGGPAYITSKHDLVGLTRSVTFFYRSDGISANAICPGLVRTNIGTDREFDQGGMRRVDPILTLGGEPVEPEQIASVAVFLASDAASLVNGVALPDEGGWAVA